jgi:hypothetical protein
MDGAEAVCNTRNDLGADLFETMASLVDKSLIQQVEHRKEARLLMLETISARAQCDKLPRLSATTRWSFKRPKVGFCSQLSTNGTEWPFLERDKPIRKSRSGRCIGDVNESGWKQTRLHDDSSAREYTHKILDRLGPPSYRPPPLAPAVPDVPKRPSVCSVDVGRSASDLLTTRACCYQLMMRRQMMRGRRRYSSTAHFRNARIQDWRAFQPFHKK